MTEPRAHNLIIEQDASTPHDPSTITAYCSCGTKFGDRIHAGRTNDIIDITFARHIGTRPGMKGVEKDMEDAATIQERIRAFAKKYDIALTAYDNTSPKWEDTPGRSRWQFNISELHSDLVNLLRTDPDLNIIQGLTIFGPPTTPAISPEHYEDYARGIATSATSGSYIGRYGAISGSTRNVAREAAYLGALAAISGTSKPESVLRPEKSPWHTATSPYNLTGDNVMKIFTTEQLQALPLDTAIIDKDGLIGQIRVGYAEGTPNSVYSINGRRQPVDNFAAFLPAVVMEPSTTEDVFEEAPANKHPVTDRLTDGVTIVVDERELDVWIEQTPATQAVIVEKFNIDKNAQITGRVANAFCDNTGNWYFSRPAERVDRPGIVESLGELIYPLMITPVRDA